MISEDFGLLVSLLQEILGTYDATLYAYTLMSNHVHLPMKAPRAEALGRLLHWFMTEFARAFHRARGSAAAPLGS